MCGIVAIAGDQEKQWILDMNNIQYHRGPDEGGLFCDEREKVSLAMRRLSILDLAGGHQPMANEDESIWIIFNGEIFNAPKLRVELEENGYKFFTRNSDTEVVLKLYECKGESLLSDLNGMFGFVIYDRKKNILLGVRDRFGIKPLYYSQQAGRLAIASELKSLLTLPYISRDINFQSLYHYMTLLYIPDEDSIINGIKRLPPGHKFRYNLTTKILDVSSYWKPEFSSSALYDVKEWQSIIRHELGNAVKRWTLSDVPIACSLSGGIDSSTIVGLLAEQGVKNIKTYSLGFVGEREQEFNEIDLAGKVAEKWQTDHHEIILEPDELLNDLIQMVWHLEEPYAGGLPSWYVFKAMSQDVKVGLTGTGGDELFGNYGKWKIYEQSALIRLGLSMRCKSKAGANILASIISPVSYVSDQMSRSMRTFGKKSILSRIPNVLREPFGTYYYANFLYFSDKDKKNNVFDDKLFELESTSTYLQRIYDQYGIRDIRNGIAAVDLRTQLAEEFLFMSDRFSMAHSLEARVPFLDHLFVESVFKIPPLMRTSKNNLKYLLIDSVKELLPEELITAKKRGFIIPKGFWLTGKLKPLVEKVLNPDRLKEQGILKPDFYHTFVVPHFLGKKNNTSQIWAALMFQLWYIVFIENYQNSEPTYTWEDIK